MVKTKNIKQVPDLRFSEFEEEWTTKKIKDIFVVKAGGDIDSAHVSKTKTDIFKYPIYANAEKGKGFYGFSDQFKVSVPSVTVAGRGVNVGIAHARDHKFYPIVRLLILTPKKEQSIFFFQYGINQFNIFIESTGVPQLTGPQISTYRIAFPSLPEQEKIASFLSAVDKKVQQLTAKKELLEQYKKGVMQKIFSQEIRFTDANRKDYHDWEERRLGEVLTERKSLSIKGSGYEHISLTKEGVVPKTKRYERDFLVGDDSSKKYKITYINDICYNPANLKFGVICRNSYGTGIFSPIYVTFEVVNNDVKFIEYLLTRRDFIQKARRFEEGTVYERMAVKPADFVRLIISLPTLSEQQKIAQFILGIEIKIKTVQTQLTQTQTFKKGLLQQLFV